MGLIQIRKKKANILLCLILFAKVIKRDETSRPELLLLTLKSVHFRFKGCQVVYFLFILILLEILWAKKKDSDQTPHNTATYLGIAVGIKRTLG